MSRKKLSIFVLSALLFVVSPLNAFAADSNVGNEVVDTFNTTLTRTGVGTAANPYKLQLNLGNANTWTGTQTFNAAVTAAGGFTSTGTVTSSGIVTVNNVLNANGTLNANGALNLGDGGDVASLSGTTVTVNAGDNNANAFLVQQGTIKYLQVNTTNGAENVSFGNTTTNPTFSFLGSGATTFNSAVTTTNNLNANGNSTFAPSGTNDVSVVTDGDSKVVITGLTTATGDALCLNASNELVLCSVASASTLQGAYDGGNIITTSDSRDIQFGLEDTITDSDFRIYIAADNTVAISRNDNANIELPSQLLLLENLDTDQSVDRGLNITAVGGMNTAIDATDAEIVTALAAGTNDLNGTNWSISGATGNIVTSGDVSVGGGDITTVSSTGNLFNTAATTVNVAGAATSLVLGANTGIATIRNSTVSLPNAFTVNATSATANFDTVNVGGGYGSSGVTVSNTGNVQTNGNITVDGTGTFTGNVTAVSDVAVNGGDLTTTSPTANIFNSGATTLNIGGAAFSVNIGGFSGMTVINSNLVAQNNVDVMGQTTFSPTGPDDVTVNTDSDSNLVLTGLQTATGDGLCIDASNNVIKCSGSPSDVRLKKNITPLTDVLPRVLQAQGVRYDLLKDAESAPGEGKNIGFIAQELEVLFPEVVKTDAKGIKSVDYEKMTAVLVESTKEQQKQIDELKAEVQSLKEALQNR